MDLYTYNTPTSLLNPCFVVEDLTFVVVLEQWEDGIEK